MGRRGRGASRHGTGAVLNGMAGDIGDATGGCQTGSALQACSCDHLQATTASQISPPPPSLHHPNLHTDLHLAPAVRGSQHPSGVESSWRNHWHPFPRGHRCFRLHFSFRASCECLCEGDGAVNHHNTIDCTVALGSLHTVLLEATPSSSPPPLLCRRNLPAQHHPEARHPRSFNWPAGWEEW